MHFEILVEDQSGKVALEKLLPKIIPQHSFRIHAYRGIGHIPHNLAYQPDPKKRVLLENLPRLLKGYGKSYPQNRGDAHICVVIDLDRKDEDIFLGELYHILENCNPAPAVCFCFAIEEGEAWLLGDMRAIEQAYPHVNHRILESYVNDSICGTWEVLADALRKRGEKDLRQEPWFVVGKYKCEWAEKITLFMNIDENTSPSFCKFRDKLRHIANTHT